MVQRNDCLMASLSQNIKNTYTHAFLASSECSFFQWKCSYPVHKKTLEITIFFLKKKDWHVRCLQALCMRKHNDLHQSVLKYRFIFLSQKIPSRTASPAHCSSPVSIPTSSEHQIKQWVPLMSVIRTRNHEYFLPCIGQEKSHRDRQKAE